MSRLFVIALLFLVPSLNAASPLPQADKTREEPGRISINTATVDELQRLPGIGPVLAERIVEHRKSHGRFRRIEDVIIVRGMSAARFRRIAHLIRI